MKLTLLLILVYFVCKAAETRKYTRKVNKSLCCPEIHKLQIKTNDGIFVLKCLNFFIVLCILLIISGIEINPGPSDSDNSSSSSSDFDNTPDESELVNNTFSFLHLNIQRIVFKIQLGIVMIYIQYWSVDGKYRIYLTRLRNGVKDELLASFSSRFAPSQINSIFTVNRPILYLSCNPRCPKKSF